MHISIIDDEKVLTSKISKKLILNWYTVSEYYSYKEFMKAWVYEDISDLYIIDLSLWDWSWFDIIRFLRENKKIKSPIIIMSWFWDTQNIIFWLDLWADDYITKPFPPDELLARVRAIFRRPPEINLEDEMTYKSISINNVTKKVKLNWIDIELTRKESLILELFIKNRGVLVEKDSMIKHIWWVQTSLDVNDNTINATLSKLRKKMWGSFPLQTKHNLWYILE